MELTSNQQSAISQLRHWKVGALFMEPGTGKTRAAIELIRQCPDIDYVLWIGPLRTIRTEPGISSVPDEVDKWGGFGADAGYLGVESIGGSSRIYLNAMEEVQRHKCVFCVVDESLKIKNANAKRTRRVMEIGKLCSYRLILNGTPLTRNIVDMWAQMEFLSPKILNMTLAKFKSTFCKMRIISKSINGRKYWEKEYITGFTNLDYLHSLTRHYVYQCDLNLNISQSYRHRWFSLSYEEKERYQEIKDYFLEMDELIMRNDNIFYAMTQKLQHSYCLCEDKFRIVDDILEKHSKDKVIIFCKYITSREECEKRYPGTLVLSYQKESMGLNLQDYNVTIYFDKVWDYALMLQSSRRTYRTGQTEDCVYYNLTGNVGLESLIDDNIDKKISMSEYFKKINKEELKKELKKVL